MRRNGVSEPWIARDIVLLDQQVNVEPARIGRISNFEGLSMRILRVRSPKIQFEPLTQVLIQTSKFTVQWRKAKNLPWRSWRKRWPTFLIPETYEQTETSLRGGQLCEHRQPAGLLKIRLHFSTMRLGASSVYSPNARKNWSSR